MLADLLDPFEKVGAGLTDESVAKLSAQTTDVVSKRRVEFRGSIRHVGTVAGTDPGLGLGLISLVSVRTIGWSR